MQNQGKTQVRRETSAEWEQRVRKNIASRQLDAAREELEDVLDADAHNAAALSLMGELYFEHGDLRQAIGHYVLAITENPENFSSKERFIELAGFSPFYKANDVMRKVLLTCLQTPKLDCARAQILWYTLLMTHPAFKNIYKSSNFGSTVSFNIKAFDRAKDTSALLDPFFLDGLKKIAVYHPVFEEFLTYLRKCLLNSLEGDKPRFARDSVVRIAGALAHYCFYTEYIFDVTPEEKKALAALRERLETDEEAMKDAAAVAVFGCYEMLYGLKSFEKIASLHREGPIADVIALQIDEQSALVNRRGSIEAITIIDKEFSEKMQGQYEEFPYPRWKTYSRLISDEEAEGGLRGKKIQILVGGCGTGREPIQLAAVFPDSHVLGIDLSRSSLSYAIGRAEDLGVRNVEFKQADILHVGNIGREFDYISSSGVLHHMKNLEGWDVLCGLLKPGGLMRIALYSEIARRNIVKAHEAIEKGGYDSTAEGMRKFRRESPDLLDRTVMQDLMNRGDYYHLSMYRDLLFHVQEFRVTIPQIAEKIKSLGLEFVKFGVEPQVLVLYRKMFPDESKLWDLDNWHAFEQEYPDTFSNMYHFFCRKKAA